METIRIGILRERKIPADKRVAFSPEQCKQLMEEYPFLKIQVEKSPIRCYSDEEYSKEGIEVTDDLSNCDILIGIKEISKDFLYPNKKYLFFSHTIKKQPHNQSLLQTILNNNITLIDYECLTDQNHNRIIGFGRYAGIVGCYNGLRAYGLRYGIFDLKPAYQCFDRKELESELQKVKLPNIKIALTGGGRVANGVIETLGLLKVRKVTPYEYLHCHYREPVYCQLHSKDYHLKRDGSTFQMDDFVLQPELYVSTFNALAKVTDLLLTAHFWDPKAPKLFSKEEMRNPDFKISVIADISCDIEGSVPSTLRPSTITAPFYDYNPVSETEVEAFDKNSITVMAVDNLPCELPRDASYDFGKDLMDRVMEHLLKKDEQGIIERATIVSAGRLMPAYQYLKGYVTPRD